MSAAIWVAVRFWIGCYVTSKALEKLVSRRSTRDMWRPRRVSNSSFERLVQAVACAEVLYALLLINGQDWHHILIIGSICILSAVSAYGYLGIRKVGRCGCGNTATSPRSKRRQDAKLLVLKNVVLMLAVCAAIRVHTTMPELMAERPQVIAWSGVMISILPLIHWSTRKGLHRSVRMINHASVGMLGARTHV